VLRSVKQGGEKAFLLSRFVRGSKFTAKWESVGPFSEGKARP
jgi:hypothetical protein